MLREAADVWWSRINREVVEEVNKGPKCLTAGENIKCLNSQNEYGKIPVARNPIDEISIDFVGAFQNAKKNGKYLLVSVENSSG